MKSLLPILALELGLWLRQGSAGAKRKPEQVLEILHDIPESRSN